MGAWWRVSVDSWPWVMGAVGAHAVAEPRVAALAETASLYELIHAVVLLWLCGARGRYAMAARWSIMVGTVLFCGTIYLKALLGWETPVRLAPLEASASCWHGC